MTLTAFAGTDSDQSRTKRAGAAAQEETDAAQLDGLCQPRRQHWQVRHQHHRRVPARRGRAAVAPARPLDKRLRVSPAAAVRRCSGDSLAGSSARRGG